jgi:UDP-N-acetylglucosamine 3-dehydrogenase
VATGSKGIAYLDYIEQTLVVHNGAERWQAVAQKTEPLKLELEHFLKCVTNGCSPLVDGREGTRVLELCLEASKSQNGTWRKPSAAQPVA